MANSFLNKVLKNFNKTNIKARSTQSANFFKDQIKRLGGTGAGEILRTSKKKRNNIVIGRMYVFRYDPKFKKTLPFYDRFPLIFPIGSSGQSFLGINLHYLNPKSRLVLLNKLNSLATNRKFNSQTKLKISYSILNAAKRFNAFRPTIKRYLISHVRSAFIEIPADQWELAVLLPLADFKKASSTKVWADSRGKF